MERVRFQENLGPNMLNHIREYSGSERFLGYAFATQDLYILDLTRFQMFCEESQGELNQKLNSFLKSLSSGSRNRAFSALRGFLDWAQAETIVAPEENPLAEIDHGKREEFFRSLNS